MALWVAVLLAAAAPLKVGVLGFSHANVADGVAEVASDHFAQQLAKQGLGVVTSREMAALLGVERQKQLLGCADSDSSCLMELSNGLGADAIVTGSLGRFGSRFTVNIKVTRSGDGASLAVFSAEVGSEDELPATLSRAAADIADQLRPKPQGAGVGLKVGMVFSYAAAAISLGGSVVSFVLAGKARDSLVSPMPSFGAAAAFQTRSDGQSLQTAGFILLTTGIVLALIGGVLAMLGAGR